MDRRETCKDCWARYLCGGGCYSQSHLVHGRLDLPDPCECALKQHFIHLAAYLLSRLRQEKPRVLAALSGSSHGAINPHAVAEADRAARPLTLDLPVSAWHSRQPLQFCYARQMQDRLWRGLDDLSGRVHLQWDAAHLYVCAEIEGARLREPYREVLQVQLTRALRGARGFRRCGGGPAGSAAISCASSPRRSGGSFVVSSLEM